MARYKVTIMVEAARTSAVEKILKEHFPLEQTAIKKLDRTVSRADRLGAVEETVSDAMADVTELKDELQEWVDNLPENLQNGSKADEINEAISALEDIEQNLMDVDFSSVSFPGMY